ILAGMDANDGGTAGELRNLAEEWGIPVIVSPKAKGVFREDHQLFLGTIEMLGTGRLYEYIDGSDLVLMIGFDPVEFDRDWAVTGQCLAMYQPKTFFMSNGLSSMGYGLAAALGLKLLHRDREVACVLGDGGFAMMMAELETAVREKLGVTVIVLADDALSQIKANQERKGYPVTGTTFGGLDYVALAKGFGIKGHDVRTVAEC